MELFRTGEGRIHIGRAAFVGFVIITFVYVASCDGGRIGGAFVTFIMGWWTAFCGKHPPDHWAEYNANFRMRFGIGFFVACVAQGVSALWLLYYRGH